MAVMETRSKRLLATLAACGKRVVVSIDQTALDKERAIGRVSARVGERALPLFWGAKAPVAIVRSQTIFRCWSGGPPAYRPPAYRKERMSW